MCLITHTSTGALRGARGALAPHHWNLKKMTSDAAVLRNTLKLSLAPALAINTFRISVKRRENATIVVCAFGAPKKVNFFLRRTEKLSIVLGVGVQVKVNILLQTFNL